MTAPEDEAEIDFGTRRCPLCQQDIPAMSFGRHVLVEHGPSEVKAHWPNGSAGFLQALDESLQESLERAQGHPQALEMLERSRATLEQMRAALESV